MLVSHFCLNSVSQKRKRESGWRAQFQETSISLCEEEVMCADPVHVLQQVPVKKNKHMLPAPQAKQANKAKPKNPAVRKRIIRNLTRGTFPCRKTWRKTHEGVQCSEPNEHQQSYCREVSYPSLRNKAPGPEKFCHPWVLGHYEPGGEHLWILSSSDNHFEEQDHFLLPPTLNIAAVEQFGTMQTWADIWLTQTIWCQSSPWVSG